MNNDRLVYSVSELAVVLGMHEKTVYKLIRANAIPSKRFGRRIIVPKSVINSLLAIS